MDSIHSNFYSPSNSGNPVVAKAVALLHEMIEYKNKARCWEEGLYPVSVGGDIRINRPHVRSPEVQALVATGLVSYLGSSTNPKIPDGVLRILNENVEAAQGIITRYLSRIPKV